MATANGFEASVRTPVTEGAALSTEGAALSTEGAALSTKGAALGRAVVSVSIAVVAFAIFLLTRPVAPVLPPGTGPSSEPTAAPDLAETDAASSPVGVEKSEGSPPIAKASPPASPPHREARTESVSGEVIDQESREPVRGVTVTLFRDLQPELEELGRLVTGRDGAFHFPELPPANYAIEVDTENVHYGRTYLRSFTLSRDGYHTRIFLQPRLTIAGRVVDPATNAPLVGITLQAEAETEAGEHREELATTDVDGRFDAELGVVPAMVHLSGRYLGELHPLGSIAPKRQDCRDLVLYGPSVAPVSGTVVVGGSPVADVLITMLRPADSEGTRRILKQTITDARGRFVCDSCSCGDVIIVADHLTLATWTSETLSLTPAGLEVTIDAELGADLSGVVTDATGLPVRGTKIEVLRGQRRIAEAECGPAGEFQFETLPAGTFTVRATPWSLPPTEVTIEISPPEPAYLAVTLERWDAEPWIHGVITWADGGGLQADDAANLTLTATGPDGTTQRVPVERYGNFGFRPSDIGVHQLIAEYNDGQRSTHLTADVRPHPDRLQLALAPFSAVLLQFDPDASPVNVRLVRAATPSGARSVADRGATGFHFVQLAPGTYRAEIEWKTGRTITHEFTVEPDPISKLVDLTGLRP